MQETWFNPCVGKIPWKREWLPTPVFLPGEFHKQRRLAGYCPWGHKDSDTIERLTLTFLTCEMESLKLPILQDGGERENTWVGCRHSI